MPLVVFLLGCAILSLLCQLVVAIWENIWTVIAICTILALTAAVFTAIVRAGKGSNGDTFRRMYDEHQNVLSDRDQWRQRALAAEQCLSSIEARVNEASRGTEERIAAAERRARAAEERQATRKFADAISPQRIKHLLMLCHPDKHGNSALANDVTKWLLTMKLQNRN